MNIHFFRFLGDTILLKKGISLGKPHSSGGISRSIHLLSQIIYQERADRSDKGLSRQRWMLLKREMGNGEWGMGNGMIPGNGK